MYAINVNSITHSKSYSVVPCVCGETPEKHNPLPGAYKQVFGCCGSTITPEVVLLVSGSRTIRKDGTPTMERVALNFSLS